MLCARPFNPYRIREESLGYIGFHHVPKPLSDLLGISMNADF